MLGEQDFGGGEVYFSPSEMYFFIETERCVDEYLHLLVSSRLFSSLHESPIHSLSATVFQTTEARAAPTNGPTMNNHN